MTRLAILGGPLFADPEVKIWGSVPPPFANEVTTIGMLLAALFGLKVLIRAMRTRGMASLRTPWMTLVVAWVLLSLYWAAYGPRWK